MPLEPSHSQIHQSTPPCDIRTGQARRPPLSNSNYRLERFGHEPPATPAGRLIAGVLAVDRALAGDPAHEVVALAERMLETGRLPSGRIAAQIPLFATNALLWSDRFEHSRQLLEQMIAAARAAGSARGVIIALCWRGLAPTAPVR
jgi:hypothetical protein